MKKSLIVFTTIISLSLLPLQSFAAKGGEKGPDDRAYERASDNASFKRDGKHKDKYERHDSDDGKKDKKKKHKDRDDRESDDRDKRRHRDNSDNDDAGPDKRRERRDAEY